MENILEYGKAICYSGYREGQSPKTTAPSKEQIAEDLEIIINDGYRYIRMYDPNIHAERVLEVIREKMLPLKCMIGIDSDPEVNNPNCPFAVQNFTDEELKANAERNDNELDKLIDLIKRYPDEIVAAAIGNENTPDWGAHIVPVERLIAHAKKLKAATGKPITFCEGAPEWLKLKELGDCLDIISIHSYPLHVQVSIDKAMELNIEHYASAKEMFPDKQVVFTEVGWTSRPSGHMIADDANEENQAIYLKALNSWLEENQVIGFIFEAFDEPWKGSTPESGECNWGLYYVDRTPKLYMKQVKMN